MSIAIPSAIEAVVQCADLSSAVLDELSLGTDLIKVSSGPKAISDKERRGVFSEIAAWGFMRPHGSVEKNEPWGIYWRPLGSGTLADGKPFYSPNIAELDADILLHWVFRAENAKHPLIRARYADLAWEIGRYLKRDLKDRITCPSPVVSVDLPFTLVQKAVDGYLDGVELRLAKDEYHSWVYIERAIVLAISINDQSRGLRAKSVLFAYHRSLVAAGGKFMWWRFDDITIEREKTLSFTDADAKEVLDALECALIRYSDISNRQEFDPHAALSAVDHLIHRFGTNRPEIQRVIKIAGTAFEGIAKEAAGLVAIAWLEDLIPRYRAAGLVNDSARVERLIRERAEQARGEMKRISVPIDISREEMEKWADAVIGSNLQEALGRIAWHCMALEDKTKESLKSMADKAPLVSMLSTAVMGVDGFTEAKIYSVEDDFDGRAMQHAADRFNWRAPFLYFALNRMKEKYGFDLDQLVAFINEAPFFAPAREALLRDGLAAWLAEDPVKAIHVLVPQVEAACRDLLVALGAPVMRHDPNTGGFEVIGMGAVLSNPVFREGVHNDIRFHLRALYTDPRGLNLRNHLAHGLAHVGLLGMGVANWVVHSILLLAMLRIRQNPKTASDDGSKV